MNENKLKLFVNQNCQSCMIMGHKYILDLARFNIVREYGKELDYPFMIKDGRMIVDIELFRELFKPQEISDEELRNIIDSYDHRNCLSCGIKDEEHNLQLFDKKVNPDKDLKLFGKEVNPDNKTTHEVKVYAYNYNILRTGFFNSLMNYNS